MKNLTLLLLLFSAYTTFSQTTIVIQPDASSGKDAKVFSLDPSQNFGTDVDFIAATWTFSNQPGKLRSIIQFDLSSIPPGATVLDAKLSLFYNFVSGSAGQAGNNASFLRRITDSWDENTVTWNTQPSTTNINQVYLPKSTAPDQDYENINVAPLIKDMLANPSQSYGFMIMEEVEAVLSSMKFFSSDVQQASQRPKLEITYTTEPLECITIQPDSEGKDAKVFSLSPGTNFGNDLDFIAAAWTFSSNDGILRSYLDFDLSVLPPNAEVVTAALSLYYNDETSSAGQAGTNNALLQRVLEPWTEQSITWNNQPSATHLNELELPISTSSNQDYIDINVTNLVRDMVNLPAQSYGFMLKQSDEVALRSMKFSSSDVADHSKHPKLDICYRINTANKEIQFNQAVIQPNPFDNSFTIQQLSGKYVIYISDLNGKIIHTAVIESLDGNARIENLDFLPSGIYFVKAVGSLNNYFGKIIKSGGI
ncbi:MAG: DNRLRE domain-containing protein [Chitinophagales bacterium]